MSRATRGTPSGDAYLYLQSAARRTKRPTQELLQLYLLEGFLARLAISDVRGERVGEQRRRDQQRDARTPTCDSVRRLGAC